MSWDQNQPPWHDLINAAPTTSRRPTPPRARRQRRHTVQNATMAGAHLFVSAAFGWTATAVDPTQAGNLQLTAVLVSGNAAATALVVGLAAITAARAARQRRIRPMLSAVTWLNRLHLSAALAYLLYTAVTRPATTALALIPVMFAATGWSLLLDTRDTIRRSLHPCAGCPHATAEGTPHGGDKP